MLTSLLSVHLKPAPGFLCLTTKAARFLGGASQLAGHSRTQEERNEYTVGPASSKDSDALAAAPPKSSIWPSLPTSRAPTQRLFSTQAAAGKMATAQTIQQRTSLDLALANPVYQGGEGVAGVTWPAQKGRQLLGLCGRGL